MVVLDGDANPIKRIWCLFEINQAANFGKPFHLIVDEVHLDEVGKGEAGRDLIDRNEAACVKKTVEEHWFEDFDARVGGLIAGTMLSAGMEAESPRIFCMRSVWGR